MTQRALPRFRALIALLLLTLMVCGAGAGGPDASVGAEAPEAAASTRPASAPAENDPEAVAWLDRIAAAAQNLKSLQANLRWDRIQGLLGDEQRRFGTLTYIATPPARFAVHFTRLYVDETWRDQDRRYIFDGVWLVEKLDDQKRFTKRQVVAPGTGAEALDPLSAGSGPFAIPISPNKDRLLERFSVQLIEPADGDPENSVHLELTPRPPHDAGFVKADVWYDRESLLPVRARSVDDSENISIVHLSDLKMNAEVDSKLIDVREPREAGWHVEIVPWEER